MANPDAPRPTDPLDPARPRGTGDPVIDNRSALQPRRSRNSGWLIALIVVILALVAYYIFGRGSPLAPVEQPAATEPAPADGGTMKPAEPASPPANNSATPAPATPPADGGTTAPAPANPQ